MSRQAQPPPSICLLRPENYYPNQDYTYTFPAKNGISNTLFLSSQLQNQATFELHYGWRIPFQLFRNNFHIIPYAGLQGSLMQSSELVTFFPLYNTHTIEAPSDTVGLRNINVPGPGNFLLFLHLGAELETRVFSPQLAFTFRAGYNFGLEEAMKISVDYERSSESKSRRETLPYRLSNGHVSVGLRYYFRKR